MIILLLLAPALSLTIISLLVGCASKKKGIPDKVADDPPSKILTLPRDKRNEAQKVVEQVPSVYGGVSNGSALGETQALTGMPPLRKKFYCFGNDTVVLPPALSAQAKQNSSTGITAPGFAPGDPPHSYPPKGGQSQFPPPQNEASVGLQMSTQGGRPNVVEIPERQNFPAFGNDGRTTPAPTPGWKVQGLATAKNISPPPATPAGWNVPVLGANNPHSNYNRPPKTECLWSESYKPRQDYEPCQPETDRFEDLSVVKMGARSNTL